VNHVKAFIATIVVLSFLIFLAALYPSILGWGLLILGAGLCTFMLYLSFLNYFDRGF